MRGSAYAPPCVAATHTLLPVEAAAVTVSASVACVADTYVSCVGPPPPMALNIHHGPHLGPSVPGFEMQILRFFVSLVSFNLSFIKKKIDDVNR